MRKKKPASEEQSEQDAAVADIKQALSDLGVKTADDARILCLIADRLLCEKSFYHFVRTAWCHIPGQESFEDNWHVACLCYHLQALWEKQCRILLVNISPSCGKSLISSVLFPAWIWMQMPSAGMWLLSFSQSLILDHADKAKQFLESKWFRELMGDQLAIRPERSALDNFHNFHGGFRMCSTVNSKTGTGFHPHLIGIDDAHNPREVVSPAITEVVRNLWSDTIPTRGALRGALRFHIAQRLGETDLTQHILDTNHDGLVHVRIPMKFEADNPCKTPIRYLDIDDMDEQGYPKLKVGWEDPRKDEGEWMWPGFFTEEIYLDIISGMRPHQVAGQFQQRPSSPQGDMFVKDMFGHVVDKPPEDGRAVRAWDKASSVGKKADWTVGALLVYDGQFYYVVDIKRFKKQRKDRDAAIAEAAEADASLYGRYQVRFEQEGASSGKDAAEIQAEELSHRFTVRIDKAMGKPRKYDDPLKGWDRWHELLSRGLVKFVNGPWMHQLIHEHTSAPVGGHDDIIDACALAARTLSAGLNYQKIKRPLLLITDEEQDELDGKAEKKVCDVCAGLGCRMCNFSGFSTNRRSELESLIPPPLEENEFALMGG